MGSEARSGERPRIAIAGFQHETNTFAPHLTSYQDFQDGGGWPPITFGADVPGVFRGLNIPIGGFIAAADGSAELIPVLWASAEPASYVSMDAFDRISGAIISGIQRAGPLDGIYLDLHGAMVVDGADDGEGELLRRLRERIGPEMPVVLSLDLHANLSNELVAQSDAIAIYRTYPHLDMDQTGARAWDMMRAILHSGRKPKKAVRHASQLIPLSAQCTDFGVLADLYGSLEATTGDPFGSADIALGFPLADVSDVGPSVVAYGSDQADADRRADLLLAELSCAADVVDNTMLAPDAAVARACDLTQGGGTVVLADVQDNSGAGAMSDTTGLLAALLDGGTGPCLIGTLWDPEMAAQAHTAGQGARITAEIGGRSGPDGVAPVTCPAVVQALSDGRFVCTGAMQRDVLTDIGPSALLGIETETALVSVLISSRRHQSIDQEVFRHLGAEPSDFRIVALKSTVHFRADFTPIAREVIAVVSPGYSWCRPEMLEFRNR